MFIEQFWKKEETSWIENGSYLISIVFNIFQIWTDRSKDFPLGLKNIQDTSRTIRTQNVILNTGRKFQKKSEST